MTKIETDKRIEVLRFSLNLEYLASTFLAYLLDINNIQESKSLGNGSSSISFNQKLNLLLDNNSINKKEKDKLDSIMSIRNQFMHNINVNTFQEAFNCIDGRALKMQKIYPDKFVDNKTVEESLEKCVEQLFIDGMHILTEIKGGRERKMNIEAERSVFKSLYEATSIAVVKSIDELVLAIENNEFDYKDKKELTENIEVLKVQILTNQIVNGLRK